MPCQDPVRDIRRTDDHFKDVAVFCSVRPWDTGHDGSLWVHTSWVINIPTRSGNINTTIQTPNGEVVLVTVSWSGRSLEVKNGWLNSGVQPIFCVSPKCFHNIYRPSYLSSWQQDLSKFFATWNPIPSDTFPKQSGQWWCWYIVEVRFEMRGIWNLISGNSLLFAQDFFNFIAWVWFNGFTRVWFNCFAPGLMPPTIAPNCLQQCQALTIIVASTTSKNEILIDLLWVLQRILEQYEMIVWEKLLFEELMDDLECLLKIYCWDWQKVIPPAFPLINP